MRCSLPSNRRMRVEDLVRFLNENGHADFLPPETRGDRSWLLSVRFEVSVKSVISYIEMSLGKGEFVKFR